VVVVAVAAAVVVVAVVVVVCVWGGGEGGRSVHTQVSSGGLRRGGWVWVCVGGCVGLCGGCGCSCWYMCGCWCRYGYDLVWWVSLGGVGVGALQWGGMGCLLGKGTGGASAHLPARSLAHKTGMNGRVCACACVRARVWHRPHRPLALTGSSDEVPPHLLSWFGPPTPSVQACHLRGCVAPRAAGCRAPRRRARGGRRRRPWEWPCCAAA
jgi:hypothetical protein